MSEADVASCGEWHHTSKATGGMYGQKGEAIAAVAQLARRVQIRSKTQFDLTMSIKTIQRRDDGIIDTWFGLSVDDSARQGTKVTVDGLFTGLPVRVSATRRDVEIKHIKDLVRHVSVLHHTVSWLVVDCTDEEEVLCRYGAASSVPRRFAALHGEAVLATVKVNKRRNGSSI